MTKDDYYLSKLKQIGGAGRIFERVFPKDDVKNIHIVGICGTAMGSLAGLLTDGGYKVTGSDTACHPPISDMLTGLNIDYKEGFDIENLKDKDLIVVGNVSGPNNEEAKFARENNLPVMSFPEALKEYVAGDKKRLIVSGTHGKTTTTGILSSIFIEAKFEPGFFIGGVMQGQDKSYKLGKGEYFIMEGDEYDTSYFDKRPKFLVYEPTSAIVTSMELDHLDIYEDFTDYKMAFQFLAEEIPQDGFLVLNKDDKNVSNLEHYTKANVVTYGTKDADVTFSNLKTGTKVQAFDLIYKGENLGRLETPLAGEYNVLNICAASALALQYGVKFEDIFEAVKNFNGMKRRQEVVFDEDVTLIDDFAHHPTSVKETLSGLKKKYKGRRLVTLFEPRSNSSRKKIFENDYIQSFDDADLVYMKIPPFRHNDKSEDFMDAQKVISEISKKGKTAKVFENADEIVTDLMEEKREGDVIIMMSNGSFDGLKGKLLEKLG